MFRRHEKSAALPQRDANPMNTDHPAGVTNSIVPGKPRSERELLAIFDAAVYRALLREQQKVAAFVAGGGRVHSR